MSCGVFWSCSKNELRDGVVPSVFSWIRTSPRKGKEPAERNFELTASKSASRKLSTPAVVLEELSNESSNELSNEMVPDLPDCSLKVEDETQTDFTDQEAYLREIIDNNNKKIHKLELISYWRSKTDNNTESDYSEGRLLTKKGRARSLKAPWWIFYSHV